MYEYMYITIEKNIKTLPVAEDTVYYELKTPIN